MLTDEQIKDLETKYSRIGIVQSPDQGKSWTVVLRKPTRPEYRRFRAESNDPRRAPDAQETLVTSTCVFPDRGGLQALLDEWPGIPEACAKVLIELAGMAGVEQGKS